MPQPERQQGSTRRIKRRPARAAQPNRDELPYEDDLAYIHNAGFGAWAEAGAAELLRRLKKRGVTSGRIVELGCGGGISSAILAAAGYDIVGFDLSAAMIAAAQARVPSGEFRCESFLMAKLPPCVAVTAIGEIFNYLFDRANTPARLAKVFARIHAALETRGLLLFDAAAPGRAGPGAITRAFREGPDWACMYSVQEDTEKRLLTRNITSFRKVGEHYRRDEAMHRLRLYAPAELRAMLTEQGFRVQVFKTYGALKFPKRHAAYLAEKR